MARSINFNYLIIAICGAPCLSMAQSIDQPDIPTGLYERKGDKIVDAPPEDFSLAKTYHSFKDKGLVNDGQRITILVARSEYKIGEPVGVLHVLESVKAGVGVYMMGPKAITDEYIDGHLVTPEGPLRTAYDGIVVSRPIADFNYEITTYTFASPGRHTIQWKSRQEWTGKLVSFESNTITINVVK